MSISNKLRITFLLSLIIIGFITTSFLVVQQKKQITKNSAAEPPNPEYIQIVNASKGYPVGHPGQDGEQTAPPYYWFTYAPSIIKKDGVYHAF